ncbi:MAG: YkoP family protein [Candidatus Limnocylindrales bacterium]
MSANGVHRGSPGPRGRRPAPSRAAAPALLDPILVAWERVDRRRRHVRPVRPGALLCVEARRHAGSDVVLRDGVVARRGDLIGELHLDNARVREIALVEGWYGIARVREDFAVLARWTAGRAGGDRPVAYHASTLLGPLLARIGFEVAPRRRTPRARLDEWFLRWLMARWSPDGQTRLARGRSRLRASECWLSADALMAGHERPKRRSARP